ncbi:hypothetical protein Gasu2_42430 [Galdieria sulphuraria]|nr:hypothetical protein Gasu2_42430 [Galdieria sulphuraria]
MIDSIDPSYVPKVNYTNSFKSPTSNSSHYNTTIQVEEERPLFEGLSVDTRPPTYTFSSMIVSGQNNSPSCKRMYSWLTILIILCINYLLAFMVYFGRLLQSDMTYVFLFRPQWLGIFFGLCPLLACLLTLGHQGVQNKIEWLLQDSTEIWPVLVVCIVFALLGAISFNISGGLEGSINIFSIIVFVCALGSLHQPQLRCIVGLTWSDATAWILMWVTLDSHWNEDLFFGRQVFVYDFWSLMFSNLSIMGWKIFRKLPGFHFRLYPVQLGDILVAISCALGLTMFLPIAVALHYVPPLAWDRLKWIMEGSLTVGHLLSVVLVFFHLFFTVALVEEILFRGVVLAGLDGNFPQYPYCTLIFSSILFGSSHWGHEHQWGNRLLTCAVDSLGGMVFGLAYRVTDYNILAPTLCHALINTGRAILF